MNEKYILGDNDNNEQQEISKGYANSYIDKNGNHYDNGGNYDERTDEDATEENITNDKEGASFESIAEDRELADYIKDQIIYAGVFIDPKELYDKFPPTLYHKIRDPHITTAYRPDARKVFLDALGSEANIQAIGYGNDGRNEGLLVEVVADDPAIQKTIKERMAIDETGEMKPVPTHITLSIDEESPAVNTKKLDFKLFKTPVELKGSYKLFRKDGVLISNKDTIRKMRQNGFAAEEVADPDRL